ncbi:hypothetical protein BDD14_6314 [Edaphobacter modestus]|uniref:Uncharacterized protein n=1 Tax=Edaphobacter modestus TaxID=388466 RepID=A0A4V2G1L6_9BACT|nr:hypothetical protein BDD14_6314 [Edaphobacter modestus]
MVSNYMPLLLTVGASHVADIVEPQLLQALLH